MDLRGKNGHAGAARAKAAENEMPPREPRSCFWMFNTSGGVRRAVSRLPACTLSRSQPRPSWLSTPLSQQVYPMVGVWSSRSAPCASSERRARGTWPLGRRREVELPTCVLGFPRYHTSGCCGECPGVQGSASSRAPSRGTSISSADSPPCRPTNCGSGTARWRA